MMKTQQQHIVVVVVVVLTISSFRFKFLSFFLFEVSKRFRFAHRQHVLFAASLVRHLQVDQRVKQSVATLVWRSTVFEGVPRALAGFLLLDVHVHFD